MIENEINGLNPPNFDLIVRNNERIYFGQCVKQYSKIFIQQLLYKYPEYLHVLLATDNENVVYEEFGFLNEFTKKYYNAYLMVRKHNIKQSHIMKNINRIPLIRLSSELLEGLNTNRITMKLRDVTNEKQALTYLRKWIVGRIEDICATISIVMKGTNMEYRINAVIISIIDNFYSSCGCGSNEYKNAVANFIPRSIYDIIISKPIAHYLNNESIYYIWKYVAFITQYIWEDNYLKMVNNIDIARKKINKSRGSIVGNGTVKYKFIELYTCVRSLLYRICVCFRAVGILNAAEPIMNVSQKIEQIEMIKKLLLIKDGILPEHNLPYSMRILNMIIEDMKYWFVRYYVNPSRFGILCRSVYDLVNKLYVFVNSPEFSYFSILAKINMYESIIKQETPELVYEIQQFENLVNGIDVDEKYEHAIDETKTAQELELARQIEILRGMESHGDEILAEGEESTYVPITIGKLSKKSTLWSDQVSPPLHKVTKRRKGKNKK